MAEDLYDDIDDAFTGGFITGKELEGEGLTLIYMEKPKFVKANKFGFEDGPHAGKTIRWTFGEDGVERIFDNNSKGFKDAMSDSGAVISDIVTISKSGHGYDTKYLVVVKKN